MKPYLVILLLVFCSPAVFAQNDTISGPKKIKEKPKSEYVSIISLIANPEKYYGKRVSVTGYMITEFEGTAIYLSREDFDNRIYKNSIFLLIGKGSDYQYYNKEYVTLDGTFIQGNGHMGLFSGMLNDVGYILKKH
jgi:uncharacterized membrane protein YcgQ (UPF0703/DUF1980 family)